MDASIVKAEMVLLFLQAPNPKLVAAPALVIKALTNVSL